MKAVRVLGAFAIGACVALLALFLLLAFVRPAPAQEIPCGYYPTIKGILENRYGETLRKFYYFHNVRIETYVSETTWTIVGVQEPMACIYGAGTLEEKPHEVRL